MRVGVVGAGIAGLAAARSLAVRGLGVVVFEKSRGVGGRIATRRHNGYIWDTGATSIAPRGKQIEAVMLHELPTENLVRVEKPIYLHSGLRPSAGDPHRSVARFAYRNGNTELPKLLAESIDLRTETPIDSVERDGVGFRIRDEFFEGVILTPPMPQVSLLLWSLRESRPIANVRYRACLSISLGYRAPTPNTAYFALLDVDQRHPLTWLSLESAKVAGRAPAGGASFGAQMSPEFSRTHYNRSDADLAMIAADYLERLYGPDFGSPDAADVMRWKYSQPEAFADFDQVNPPGSRLVIAGDSLLGGRVEDAFEVGMMAAERIAETLLEESVVKLSA